MPRKIEHVGNCEQRKLRPSKKGIVTTQLPNHRNFQYSARSDAYNLSLIKIGPDPD